MTIVELLIATTCMALVMGAVFVIFSSQSKTSTFEREIINMQLNSRVAMERLSFIFSHAGFGCTDSFQDGKTMTGDDPDNATMPIDSFLWDITNQNATGYSPDSVVVVYGFRKVAEVDGEHSNLNPSKNFKNFDGPTISSTSSKFKKYITFFPNIDGNKVYEVTSGSDPYILDESIEILLDETNVYMVTPNRVKVFNGNLQFQNFCYDSDGWDIATNIQDVQFRYTTDGSTWVEVPGKPNDVIGVAINLLVRSESEDPNYKDVKTYEYQWPDGSTEIVGPFNGTLNKYHRKHSRAHVWLRNTE